MKQQTCQNCSGVRTAGISVVYHQYKKACGVLSPLSCQTLKVIQFCHFPPALIQACQTRYASSPFSGHIVTHILILCLSDKLSAVWFYQLFKILRLNTTSCPLVPSSQPYVDKRSVTAHFRLIIVYGSVSQSL